jgi:hypothetical protein
MASATDEALSGNIAPCPVHPRKFAGTFGDLIRYHHDELTLHCEACQHRAALSVPVLAKRLGNEHPVQAFIERSVC